MFLSTAVSCFLKAETSAYAADTAPHFAESPFRFQASDLTQDPCFAPGNYPPFYPDTSRSPDISVIKENAASNNTYGFGTGLCKWREFGLPCFLVSVTWREYSQQLDPVIDSFSVSRVALESRRSCASRNLRIDGVLDTPMIPPVRQTLTVEKFPSSLIRRLL
ncbi:hypothetical protein FPV67DRAFT_781633 [Lyophyllum atratum]|nr:hypothetical protein FPV67DRAFT_781633 [Lyophyllum atratum]